MPDSQPHSVAKTGNGSRHLTVKTVLALVARRESGGGVDSGSAYKKRGSREFKTRQYSTQRLQPREETPGKRQCEIANDFKTHHIRLAGSHFLHEAPLEKRIYFCPHIIMR
ncbi:MAG: hypothetical protein P8J27_07945 [Mariniblastus sp.]|nr:hypothetical protein [Mariniblastus sp.]